MKKTVEGDSLTEISAKLSIHYKVLARFRRECSDWPASVGKTLSEKNRQSIDLYNLSDVEKFLVGKKYKVIEIRPGEVTLSGAAVILGLQYLSTYDLRMKCAGFPSSCRQIGAGSAMVPIFREADIVEFKKIYEEQGYYASIGSYNTELMKLSAKFFLSTTRKKFVRDAALPKPKTKRVSTGYSKW